MTLLQQKPLIFRPVSFWRIFPPKNRGHNSCLSFKWAGKPGRAENEWREIEVAFKNAMLVGGGPHFSLDKLLRSFRREKSLKFRTKGGQ